MKKVRGRFMFVMPLDGGGSWKVETLKTKWLTAAELACELKKYAAQIDEYLLRVTPAEDAVREDVR